MSTIQESEREEIREALVRFLRAEAGEERLREGMQRDRGYDEALWRQLADMGLLGITVSEAYGGIGGSALDAAMVAEELGRSLLPVPFIETCVMVPSLLESGDITEETQDILSAIVRGTATIAIGGNTALAPYRDPNSTLKLNSDGSVSGEVSLGMHGAHPDLILLTLGADAQTRCVL
ncbi:MAG: acyl-CoA dehydrogenase family protein, partial [Halieaceae bacterium]